MVELLAEIFKEAQDCGISRARIGEQIWGKRGYTQIYCVKNPTVRTIEKIKSAIFDIKKSMEK